MTALHDVLCRFVVIVLSVILISCKGAGGEDLSPVSVQPQNENGIHITGAGVKGPLAFAGVEVFLVDPSFKDLYDPSAPIATAVSDAHAQITSLVVPSEYQPPFVLVVDGGGAIDINTNETPYIKQLSTIVTELMLQEGGIVYATPYTTFAVEILKEKSKSERIYLDQLDSQLVLLNDIIKQSIGFGMSEGVNIFTTPPILDSHTIDVVQQQMMIDYRASIEVYSSLLYEMSTATNQNITVDELIKRLSLDLYKDGVIDNSDNGMVVGGIDVRLLSQDPNALAIAKTNYRARDIVNLIDDERSIVGGGNDVHFYKSYMEVDLKPSLLNASADYTLEYSLGTDSILIDEDGSESLDSIQTPSEPIVNIVSNKVDSGHSDIEQLGNIPEQRVSENALIVVLKFDDLKQVNGYVTQGWDQLMTYLESRGIKSGIGVITKTLTNASSSYIEWIKKYHESGLVEFWFHGWDHLGYIRDSVEYNEFVRPYFEQAERLKRSQDLARDKLGFVFKTFGPPGGKGKGSFNMETLHLMSEDEDIQVMLYPKPIDGAGEKTVADSRGEFEILDRVWEVNIESAVGSPNFEVFRDGIEKHPERKYFVLQGHPANWDAASFLEFERIIDYLISRDSVFLTPLKSAVLLD